MILNCPDFFPIRSVFFFLNHQFQGSGFARGLLTLCLFGRCDVKMGPHSHSIWWMSRRHLVVTVITYHIFRRSVLSSIDHWFLGAGSPQYLHNSDCVLATKTIQKYNSKNENDFHGYSEDDLLIG